MFGYFIYASVACICCPKCEHISHLKYICAQFLELKIFLIWQCEHIEGSTDFPFHQTHG
jgi:hypothetical protein